MRCWPSPEKLSKWLARIHNALETNTLCGGEASKLSGQLQWCSQKVFRRAGRAMVRPIIEYEFCVQMPGHYRDVGHYSARQVRARSSAVGDRLRTALQWWQQTLQLNLRYKHCKQSTLRPTVSSCQGIAGMGATAVATSSPLFGCKVIATESGRWTFLRWRVQLHRRRAAQTTDGFLGREWR